MIKMEKNYKSYFKLKNFDYRASLAHDFLLR